MAVALCVGEMHIEGLGSDSRAITISFIFMRLIQPIFNFMEGCGARSGKAVTAIFAVIFLIVMILA